MRVSFERRKQLKFKLVLRKIGEWQKFGNSSQNSNKKE